MSRIQSSIKNLATALIGQATGIIISFIARIIFLDCLNEEYLGLNGLFANILTIFSLVELGIGPAMNFSLYKPLADNDTEKVKSLMKLYQKSYIIIGILILLIGLGFTPFYTLFMEEVPDVNNLTIIYWLFVFNTSVSYFFSYKRALIICDEKRYIATIFRYSFYAVLNLLQIFVLVLTHNYILFLIVQVLATFLENVCVSIKADKMYPFLKEKNVKPISEETTVEIKKNIFAMVFHKIGSVVVFSTDNVILSKFVGLTAVGLYSNYFLIIDAINKVVGQVFNSIVASVGNLNAEESDKNPDKIITTFNRVYFLNFWIFGFCSCCLCALFNPFISLWLGSEYTFDMFTVVIIVINFYLTGMRKATSTFREATGAFYYDRYKPVFEAIINIIASIILAKYLGTAGVFLGTIISTVLVCIWVEPYVLFKHVFKKSVLPYLGKLIVDTLMVAIITFITNILVGFVATDSQLVSFVLKVIISVITPNVLFLLIFFKSDNLKYYISLLKKIIFKK